MLINRVSKRGLPKGVNELKGRYYAHINVGNRPMSLGSFSNRDEAFVAYKKEKEKHIKEVATTYYNEGKITKRVYDALMNWNI